MDSTDQIVPMLQRILDTLEAMQAPQGRNAASGTADTERRRAKAKIWIVNKLKKNGPMSRGLLNEAMSKGYREFLDQCLVELVNEGSVVYRKRPRDHRRGHRVLDLYEVASAPEPSGDELADFFNQESAATAPPTEFPEDLLAKAERHILEIVKIYGPLRAPKFENPLFPRDPEKQKPIPRLAVFHYAQIEDDNLSADAFEKCVEHGFLTVQGEYPNEECSLTDAGWDFVKRTPDLW